MARYLTHFISYIVLGNASYNSVQNLLYSSLLSENIKVGLYRTIISPVDLYGCETRSSTLTEERRLRVFENRVLKRIFGPKRDEVRGEWRKLHDEELYALFSSNIIPVFKYKRLRWTRNVASVAHRRGAYKVNVWRPEGRPRRRWENNIKMDVRDWDGGGSMDWIDLAEDRGR